MAEKKQTETPMMKQYFSFKADYPEAVLLFRCGDFYETYGDDALIASKADATKKTTRQAPKFTQRAEMPYEAKVPTATVVLITRIALGSILSDTRSESVLMSVLHKTD